MTTMKMQLALNEIFLNLFLTLILVATAQGAVASSIDDNIRCNNGDVRLTAGAMDSISGRVQVCFNNQWGSVCAGPDTPWTENNAAVVCKQLGYSEKGAVVPAIGYFGVGSGKIHLSGVQCHGNETQITKCNASFIGEYDCTHDTDVAVVCQEENFSCDDNSVRLRNGGSQNEGRVEVCFNNQYGTVCDDKWDENDANVVCKQLGFMGTGAIALQKATYGPGYGPVYLDDFKCNGEESQVSECGHSQGVYHSNCNHNEDAGVICKPFEPLCQDGEVRLVNGQLPSEGRVEVCYNGVWGTICHDLWNDNDAAVVCTQLGYSANGAKATKYADFGEGKGVIFLDSVKCKGTEKYLNECSSDPLTVHNCGHNKDAGVICEAPVSNCVDGEVRLAVNSSDHSNAGRVEICYNNHFGTVCEDDWSNEDANVVCGQLGFEKYGAVAVKGGYYGDGVGLILLDNVQCTGDETDLFKCGHNGIGTSNCYHHQDAAVICKEKVPSDSSCINGAVRLQGGTSANNEGMVQVCVNGVWSGVCGEGWDSSDAKVVCNQLGYPNTDKSIAMTMSESTTLALMSNISCNGGEEKLTTCTNALTIRQHVCEAIAGVICPAADPICSDGEVRLVGGVSANQGRVEICYNGVWGGVCGSSDDGSWSHEEAAVVCNQLGHDLSQTRSVPVKSGSFGTGSGPVYLADIHCYGNEKSLTECIGADFGYQSCSSKDVGVVCAAYPCTDGEVRLTGGSHDGEGHLQVCTNGLWRAVCVDHDHISDNHVMDICTSITGDNSLQGSYGQLGLFSSSASSGAIGGGIKGSLESCSSRGGDILQCIKQTFVEDTTTCGRHNTIGIVCSDNSVCKSGDVRLTGGHSSDEGQVEVCVGNQWSTVCEDHWTDRGAAVVCNQLGYTRQGFTPITVPGGITGNGNMLADYMKCDGSETNLLQCLIHGISHNGGQCVSGRSAAVKCITDPPTHSTMSSVNMGAATVITTTSTATLSAGIHPTNIHISNVGSNSDDNWVESTTLPKSDTNDYRNVIIPVVAMVTAIVLIVCLTIFSVIVYKWRRLTVLVEDKPSNAPPTLQPGDKPNGIVNPISEGMSPV